MTTEIIIAAVITAIPVIVILRSFQLIGRNLRRNHGFWVMIRHDDNSERHARKCGCRAVK
jgi:hypothetical protein